MTGKRKNIDSALAIALANRDNKEKFYLGETSGTIPESPLLDHPDIKGGEEPNPSMGMNTGSTVNLDPRKEELRNTLRKGLGTMSQEQQEVVLNKMLSPSEKQLRGVSPTGKNLLEQRAIANKEAIDSGFMSMSDEERAKETNRFIGQRAKDQMLEQMKKNEEDEERIKKLNLNQDRPTTTTPEQKENFKKLVVAYFGD